MKNFRYKLVLILVVLGLIGLVSGTSYAVLKGDLSSDKKQVIKTGSVKLKLTENYQSLTKKMIVLSDEEGLLQEQTFEFNIKNIGTTPAKYDLLLINQVPSDYTGNVLSEEFIKVGIEVNEVEYGPFSLDEVENIIDSNEIYEKEVINYTLRIWLDESKKDELMELDDYKSFLSLKVSAEQRVKTMDDGVNTMVFNYTGDVQKYVVPRDGWYFIELQGAQGGQKDGTERGGTGALTSGYVELEAGEKLYFYVGGQGSGCSDSSNNQSAGWNGGGLGICGSTYTGYGGGGATDVRLVPGEWDDTASLISRIMVAGGGGGGATRHALVGGYGGAAFGMEGQYYGEYGTSSTYPDSLTYGGRFAEGGPAGSYESSLNISGTDGSFGKGGNGGYYITSADVITEGAPGGGGGWYGGGGGQGRLSAAGGGSSYISGYAGVNSVEESTTITHTNETLHYSGKYFIDIVAKDGYNKGNGVATIKYFGDDKPEKMKDNVLENVRYVKNCTDGNTANAGNHINEIQAIKDGVNIAKGKTASWSQGTENTSYPLSNSVDGDIRSSNYAQGTSSVEDCLIVDLGDTYSLDEVAVWHYSGNRGGRAYYQNTYVSSDASTWEDLITDEIYIAKTVGFRYSAYHPEYNGYVYTGTNMRLWYDGFANTGSSLNRSATTWADLSERGNDGDIDSATWNPTSLSFDGTDDWVDIFYTTYVNPTLQVVVSATTDTSESSFIFSNMQYGGMTLYLNASNYYRSYTYLDESYVYSPSKLQNEEGKLYSLSTSYDGHYLTMYGNGVNYSNTTDYNVTMTIPTNSTHLILGADPSGSSTAGNFLEGNIYSARFYNRALTEEEVLHNYYIDKEKFMLYDE